ncbi:PXA domain-containing protein [Mycotypha africana]|uniref:PXA domain-containing protein n=1 Tax=Mycotypha africana TaxID=64632 RepID=UPI002300927C|nr:PXA domain-containing protein [Mycotypha africana]KAI8967691.1 PXA domain-containing protein [Mycotypha africana]
MFKEQGRRVVVATTIIILYIAICNNSSRNYAQNILSLLMLPAISFISLLALNSIVLFVYVKYFIPSNSSTIFPSVAANQKTAAQFKPMKFTHRSIWLKLQQDFFEGSSTSESLKQQLTENNEINAALNNFLKYIMRDFVESWYSKISPPTTTTASTADINASDNHDIGFPGSVECLIRSAITNIIHRVEQTDILYVILNKVIPKITFHMYEFRMAETSLHTTTNHSAGDHNSSNSFTNKHQQSSAQSSTLTSNNKMLPTTADNMIDDLFLASRFRSGQLHKALTSGAVVTTKPTEIAYLRELVERLLPFIFDAASLKEEIESEPVKIVLREILANSVLQPVMNMLADPDFWNQTIDAYLGKAIIEQKMVKQLREVLDRHSTQQLQQDYWDDEKSISDKWLNNLTTLNRNENKNSDNGSANNIDGDLQKTQLKRQHIEMSKAFSDTETIPAHSRGSGNSSDSDYNDLDGTEYKTENSVGSLLHIFKSVFDPVSLNSTPSTAAVIKTSKRNGNEYRQFGIGGLPIGKQRSFQDLMNMIQEERKLIDLKRVRNDIVTQIRKRKAQIVNHDIADRDPEEILDGEKVEDIMTYLSRLDVAKKRVDKRIAFLSGEQNGSFRNSTSKLFSMGSQKRSVASYTSPTSIRFSLKDILTNTASLSYFMEFMDRRGEIIKLQFWLIVEGFSNTDLSASRNQQRQFLDDVKMVFETYFTELSPHRIHIADQLITDLKGIIQTAEKSYANEDDAAQGFTSHIHELRLRLLRIQQYIFREIEKEHYPYFKRSDLYFKFLSSAPNMISANAIDNVNISNDTVSSTSPPNSRRSLDESELYSSQIDVAASKRPSSLHEPSITSTQSPSSLLPQSSITTTAQEYFLKNGTPQPLLSQSDSNQLTGRSNQKQRDLLIASTPSISTNIKNSSLKFNYFSSMFPSPFNYRRPRAKSSTSLTAPLLSPPTNGQKHADNQSILFFEKSSENREEEELQQQAPHLPRTLSKRTSLVRSNTVDAVEAELRSILDSNSIANIALNEDDVETSSKSFTKKAFSLCGSKANIKAATALPVQNISFLPTWTSNGGIGTENEFKHYSLEEIASSKSNGPFISTMKLETDTINRTTDSPTENDKHPSPEVDASTISDTDNSNIHLAPPGDLLLATKIGQLNEEIEKLIAQEAIVDALVAKAEEQQNKVEELRILKKSKSMFRQEIQQMQYQKSQYQLQESENVLLPQRTQVHITSATIGSDKNGDFALYIIEVQQLSSSTTSMNAEEQRYASGGWIVARRYSEFFALHQKLKEKHPVVKSFEFPSKQWPLFMKLQKSFVEARRVSLERYLRTLMADPEICNSQEFRAFLSQQNIYVPGPSTVTFENSNVGKKKLQQRSPSTKNRTSSSTSSLQSLYCSKTGQQLSTNSSPSIQHLQKSIIADNNNMQSQQQQQQQYHSKGFMRQIYKTVAAGIDDILIAPSMLDLITQRLSEQVVMEFSSLSIDNREQQPSISSSTSSSTSSVRSNKKTIPATITEPSVMVEPTTTTGTKAEGTAHFTESLCDLFIEMFELKDKTNWLRRQAIVIIIQQILEGTIERKLKEAMTHLRSPSMILLYLNKVMDGLWPNGERMASKEPRTLETKVQTRDEANRKLSTWLPGL